MREREEREREGGERKSERQSRAADLPPVLIDELDTEGAVASLPEVVEVEGPALRAGVEDGVAAAHVRQHKVVVALRVREVHRVALARVPTVQVALPKRTRGVRLQPTLWRPCVEGGAARGTAPRGGGGVPSQGRANPGGAERGGAERLAWPSERKRQKTQCSVWKIGRCWCTTASSRPAAPPSASPSAHSCAAFRSCAGVSDSSPSASSSRTATWPPPAVSPPHFVRIPFMRISPSREARPQPPPSVPRWRH